MNGLVHGGRSLAMRAAAPLIVVAAVLTLGSCQVLEFIFGSVFPATVGLTKARADLSGTIDSSSAGAFNLRVVQSGSNGYVILVGNPGGISTTAYVYDLNLNPVTTLTGLTGDGVLVDVNGNIDICSNAYSPTTMANLGALGGSIYSYNPGGVDGLQNTGTSELVNLNFTQGTTTLNFVSATSAVPPASWTFPAPTAVQTFTGSVSSLQLNAVFDDGNPSGNAILVVSQPTSGGNNGNAATCYFMTTLKANFPAGAVPPTLLSSSPSLDNIETQCVGYAQGSIIAYDAKAGQFLKVDPASGSIQKTFYTGSDMSNTRLGYLVAGGYFYGFDTRSRVLTKYATWW